MKRLVKTTVYLLIFSLLLSFPAAEAVMEGETEPWETELLPEATEAPLPNGGSPADGAEEPGPDGQEPAEPEETSPSDPDSEIPSDGQDDGEEVVPSPSEDEPDVPPTPEEDEPALPDDETAADGDGTLPGDGTEEEGGDEEETEDDLNELPAYPDPGYAMEIPDGFIVPRSTRSGQGHAKAADSGYSSFYDARTKGVVSPVKDQLHHQLCWAFSVMAVGESYLASSGQAGLSRDLSEMHLGGSFSGAAYDPLNNARGDGTYLAESFLVSGNNNKFTTFALANWVGAADEAAYPYSSPQSLTAAQIMDDVVHLTNAYWINARDTNLIRNYVISHGGVGISLYYKPEYLNAETAAYYNPDYTATNHAVTIVGWDDSFSAENFLQTPAGDGAWLIKNSAGTDFCDGGFFWVSYYDAAIWYEAATAFVFEFEPAGRYDHNYHYDGAFGTSVASLPDGGCIANTFTASGNALGGDELIRAVGVALASSGVSYEIQIYTGVGEGGDPTNGTPALETPQRGRTGLCGYYSIPLETPVRVGSGERFSVVIRLSGSGSPIQYFVDRSYVNGSWITFVNATEEGQSFFLGDGGWTDLAGRNETARIKAYTIDSDTKKIRAMWFSEPDVLVDRDSVWRQSPIIDPEDASDYVLTWESSDPAVATVAEDGTVTALEYGSAVIRVSADAGRITAEYILNVKPPVRTIVLRSVRDRMLEGETFQPRAELLPESAAPFYEIVWSSSDETVADVEDGVVHALAAGTAVISARAGTAENRYSLTVQRPISRAEVRAEPAAFTGKPAETAVRVYYEETELAEGTDYLLSFQNNAVPGTGFALVSGIGLYTGTAAAAYTIAVPVPGPGTAQNTAKGIAVSWEPADGVTGYCVYRSKNGGSWTKIKTVSGSAAGLYTDTGVSAVGSSYAYRISAFVKVGKKTYESDPCGSVYEYRVPAGKISRILREDAGLTIAWERCAVAGAYELFRQLDDGEPERIFRTDGAEILTYTDETAPEAGRKYTYTIRPLLLLDGEEHPGAVSLGKSVCVPRPPQNLAVSNAASGIALSWDGVDYATGYQIFRRTNGGPWKKVKTVKGTTLSWTDKQAVKTLVRYEYKIAAVSAMNGLSCTGAESDAGKMYRLARPKIRSTALTDEGVIIRTGAVGGAEGYVLYRSDSGGSPQEIARTADAASIALEDPWIWDSTEYAYHVRAYVEREEEIFYSSPSAAQGVLRPATVQSVVLDNAAKGIRIRWESSPGADEYRLYRSKNGGAWTLVKKAGAKTASFTDRDAVTAGARYAYRVQACAKRNGVLFRGDFSDAPQYVRLGTPAIRTLDSLTGGVRIRWGAVRKADGYDLYRAVSDGEPERIAVVGNVTEYVDASAASGQRCRYWLQARTVWEGTEYWSGMSAEKSRLYLAAPVITELRTDSSESVYAAWTPAAGAAGYELRYTVGSKTVTVAVADGTTAKTLNGLRTSGAYRFTVRSYMGSGKSKVYSAWSGAYDIQLPR